MCWCLCLSHLFSCLSKVIMLYYEIWRCTSILIHIPAANVNFISFCGCCCFCCSNVNVFLDQTLLLPSLITTMKCFKYLFSHYNILKSIEIFNHFNYRIRVGFYRKKPSTFGKIYSLSISAIFLSDRYQFSLIFLKSPEIAFLFVSSTKQHILAGRHTKKRSKHQKGSIYVKWQHYVSFDCTLKTKRMSK